MMKSTTKGKIIYIGAIAIWLLLWQLFALSIAQELFLPSPLSVLIRLFHLVFEKSFWSSILFSLSRVSIGFFSSLLIAFILASLSYRIAAIEILLNPLVKAIRAIPVASIVILTLVWVSSRNLSVVISFMVVFPIVYTGLLEGLKETPKEMLEMAYVYRIKGFCVARYIYIPYLIPYFETSLKTSLGLLPDGSIGENLYNAKVFFSTPDLFAWTVVIILLASLFEKILLFLSNRIFRRLER